MAKDCYKSKNQPIIWHSKCLLLGARLVKSFFGLIGETLLCFKRQVGVFLSIVRFAFGVSLNSRWEKQYKRCLGLHYQLESKTPRSYSILIAVRDANLVFLRETLISCLKQTAPHFEVLVGYDGPQPEEVYSVVSQLKAEASVANNVLRDFTISNSESSKGISEIINTLADYAKGEYLLLVEPNDWLRPDLLYHFAQTLECTGDAQNTVLYCDDFKIDELGIPLKGMVLRKPEKPPFPYLFTNFVGPCLMLPKGLWQKVGGLDTNSEGAHDFDLVLRLHLAKADFQNVRVPLYARRKLSDHLVNLADSRSNRQKAAMAALERYYTTLGIKGRVDAGLIPDTYRLVSEALNKKVIAVMLYKDAKEMTLKSVRSLLNQQNVAPLEIICIDNNSADLSIGEEIKKLGAKVLRIEEAFNYSRLNNLAVKSLGAIDPATPLLLINNDVELEANAVEEMLKVFALPQIGMVGCLLNYPDGRVQHGGIYLIGEHKHREIGWAYQDHRRVPIQMGFGATLMVADAVTAACVMISKGLHDEVGGFDERFYPIAFSDTDLCVRVEQRGYYSLYTPYAKGIHHESITRGKNYAEDFEGSRWLAKKLNREPKSWAPYYSDF